MDRLECPCGVTPARYNPNGYRRMPAVRWKNARAASLLPVKNFAALFQVLYLAEDGAAVDLQLL